MFGHSKRKRERRRNKREKQDLETEKATWEASRPEREKEATDFKNQQIAEKAATSKAERNAARDEEMQYAEELFSKPREGLDPATKNALQFEASNNINRAMQNANRQMLGNQGMSGITGKSGVAYAQQRDLQKVGQEAEGQATRDLTKLDRDLALKKLAAMYSHAQGGAAQSQLDKQAAKDELELGEEKKWQKEMTDKINQLFSRI